MRVRDLNLGLRTYHVRRVEQTRVTHEFLQEAVRARHGTRAVEELLAHPQSAEEIGVYVWSGASTCSALGASPERAGSIDLHVKCRCCQEAMNVDRLTIPGRGIP